MHFLDKVHPFVNYAVFGSLMGTLLVIFLIRWLYPNNSKAKAHLFILPLVIPYLTYALAMIFSFNTRCTIHGLPTVTGVLGSMSMELCRISTWVGKYLTPIFLVSAGIAVCKVVASMVTLRKYRDQFGYATPTEYGELLGIVDGLSEKLNIKAPQVIVTPFAFGQAFTTGFRQPQIVISRGVLEVADAEELEAIIAHELVHVQRMDSLTNWLSVLLRDVIFFTPVSYWTFKQYINEKELTVDMQTVRLTGKPLAYAEALIKVWRLSPHSWWYKLAVDNWSPNPSLVKEQGILERRIQRIVDGPLDNPESISGPPIVWTMISVVVVTVSGLFFIC